MMLKFLKAGAVTVWIVCWGGDTTGSRVDAIG